MNSKIENALKICPVLPVIKIPSKECITPLAETFVRNKMLFAEITFRSPYTLEAIKTFKNYSEIVVGAGTVINKTQAKQAIDVGAEFIVCPGLSEEVIQLCLEKKIPVFPGTVTPTEIMKALEYELEILKFFPAQNYGGLETMKSLSGPFPQIKFIPTGGINSDNIHEYLSQPFVKACGGSWITPKDSLEKLNMSLIEEEIKKTLSKI